MKISKELIKSLIIEQMSEQQSPDDVAREKELEDEYTGKEVIPWNPDKPIDPNDPAQKQWIRASEGYQKRILQVNTGVLSELTAIKGLLEQILNKGTM